VTLALRQAREGDPAAEEELLRLTYRELRKIAGARMREERPGHTLQPTALVHEAYMRLAGQERVEWRDRGHFYGVAAQMMRRVLVDSARERLADKRGGGQPKLVLDWLEIESTPAKLEEVLAVDQALERLQELDPQQVRIVELHYFGGLSVKDTAAALGVSARTVDRDWSMARAWLRKKLGGEKSV
jgi:RNA polymerase sigma factor (TIGR02999 family)